MADRTLGGTAIRTQEVRFPGRKFLACRALRNQRTAAGGALKGDSAIARTAPTTGSASDSPARTLRVAHVAEAFGGGLLEVVKTMAEGAAADGCEVLVAHGRRPETPDDTAALFSEAVQVVGLPWGVRSPAEQLRAGHALRRTLAGFDPDVVHVHSSFAGLVGGLVAGGRWPVIYTPHSFASCLPELGRRRRALISRAERIAIARATVVGAVSTSEARTAYELGAHHVRVIRNGIPELDREPTETGKVLTMPAMRPRVIAGGRIIGQRRPDACARILGSLHDIADVAWVGGGGETQGEWADATRHALAFAGVPVTGWLPHGEAMEEMGRATAYLHFTAWDGQALSLLEAMARDTLVIASDIEPNREVIGRHQLCATEEEAAALLRRVLGDARLMHGMLAHQRARRRRFGAQRMVQEWLSLYDAVVSGEPLGVTDAPTLAVAAAEAVGAEPATQPAAATG